MKLSNEVQARMRARLWEGAAVEAKGRGRRGNQGKGPQGKPREGTAGEAKGRDRRGSQGKGLQGKPREGAAGEAKGRGRR